MIPMRAVGIVLCLVILGCHEALPISDTQANIRRPRPLWTMRELTNERTRSKREGSNNLQDFKESLLYGSIVYVQTNKTHHIPCSTYHGEPLFHATWFAENGSHLARYTIVKGDSNFTYSDRYMLSNTYGLIISQIRKEDEGQYTCRVLPRATSTPSQVTFNVRVLDQKFPPETDPSVPKVSGNVTAREEYRVQCPVTSSLEKTPIYWSTGLGQTKSTDIIGIKFTDGDLVVMDRYHRNFSIIQNGSLLIKSVERTTRRYWCHLSVDGYGKSGYLEISGEVSDVPNCESCGSTTMEEASDVTPTGAPVNSVWIGISIVLAILFTVCCVVIPGCVIKHRRSRKLRQRVVSSSSGADMKSGLQDTVEDKNLGEPLLTTQSSGQSEVQVSTGGTYFVARQPADEPPGVELETSTPEEEFSVQDESVIAGEDKEDDADETSPLSSADSNQLQSDDNTKTDTKEDNTSDDEVKTQPTEEASGLSYPDATPAPADQCRKECDLHLNLKDNEDSKSVQKARKLKEKQKQRQSEARQKRYDQNRQGDSQFSTSSKENQSVIVSCDYNNPQDSSAQKQGSSMGYEDRSDDSGTRPPHTTASIGYAEKIEKDEPTKKR